MLQRIRLTLLAILLIAFFVPATAQTIYVDSAATGLNDGTSFKNAYNDLQVALLTGGLGAGDSIFVSKGTYKPDTGSGNRNMRFTMVPFLLIYGGFNSAAGDTTIPTRNSREHLCIMSGDIGAPGDSTDNSYNVLLSPGGLSPGSMIDGFVVRYGNANKGSGIGNSGAGMYISDNSSPIVQNMVFEYNTAVDYGGGMFVSGRYNEILNCIFRNNRASQGGGIYVNTSIYTHYPPFANLIVSENVATAAGGGIFSLRKLELINSTFNGNSGVTAGIEIQNEDIKIRNSIFWGDTPVAVLLTAATGTIDSCIVEGGCPAGATCGIVQNADPLFDNPPTDLSYGSNSPAFDAGKNNYMVLDDGDMDVDNFFAEYIMFDALGQPRIGAGSATIDIGAVEFQCVAASVTSNPSDSMACIGGGATFSSGLAGVNPMTLQWQKSTNGGSSWSNVTNGGSSPAYSGATTATLTLSGIPSGSSGNKFRLIAVNVCGGDTSLGGTLTTDNISPSFTLCHSNATMSNDAGNCFKNYSYAAVTASDNCNVDSVIQTLGLPSGSNFPVGITTNRFIAFDPAMKKDTCQFTVTVNDVDVPSVVSCPSNIVKSTDSLFCGATVNWTHPAITDACQLDAPACDTNFQPGSVFPVGITNVIYSAFDTSGNSSTCAFSITVSDTRKPAMICQSASVSLNAGGTGTLSAAAINGGTFDGCGIASSTANPNSFNCGDVGPVSVTLIAVDNQGNTDSCSASVTINDNVPPTAVCKNLTIMFDATGAAPMAAGDLDNGSSDACGISSMVAIPDTLYCGASATDTVQLLVIDMNGNSNSCNSLIAVQDTIKPLALCQPDTLILDSGATSPVLAAGLDNGSSDACGLNFSSIPAAFACSDSGLQSVDLVVTDPGGNSDTCSTNIYVMDTLGPVMVCRNDTVYLNSSGIRTINLSDVDGGTGDACGIDTIFIPFITYFCSDTGLNFVSLFATDVLANSDSCQSQLVVMDTVKPLANCKPATVYLNGSGTSSVSSGMLNNGSSDACGIASLTPGLILVNCSMTGIVAVSLQVTDVNGNVSSCNSNVTILDTISPLAICTNFTLYLNGSGTAVLAPSDIDGGSADVCGIQSRVLSKAAFNCNDAGLNAVTMTVTDSSGNSDICNFQVTVADSALPLMNCKAAVVALDSTGLYSISLSDVNNGSTDNCGIDSIWVSPSILGCGEIGNNSVFLIAADQSGNLDSCSGLVTCLDAISPIAGCQNVVLQLGVGGTVNLTANMLNNGSSDNCGIDTIWVSKTAYGCVNFGSNAASLFVKDAAGNSDTCAATVTVVDTLGNTELPVNLGPDSSICGSDSIFLDAGAGYTSYSWSTGSSAQSIQITSAGTYFVEVTNSLLCSGTDTVTFLTGSLPDSAISVYSKPVICMGDTVAVVATPGFASYSWNTGDTGNAIGAISTGTYIVTYYDISGCFKKDTTYVEFEPWTAPVSKVSPAGDFIICSDDTLTLDAGSGYFSYDWSNGATTQIIDVSLPGAYSIIVFNGFGCSDTSNVVTVDTVAAAQIPLIFPIGDSLMATLADFWQWNFFSQPILGAIGQYYLPTATGDYTVTITDSNGCSATSLVLNVVVGLEDEISLNFDVFPNPNDGNFAIRFDRNSGSGGRIQIFDLYGRKILAMEVEGSADEINIDNSGRMGAGLYIVEWGIENFAGRKRIVVH